MANTATHLENSSRPERRPWTRKEYERAIDLGLFGPDEKLELIEGEILKKMAPMNTPHTTGIALCTRALRTAFPIGHYLRIQMPLATSDLSEPEPDVAVVIGDERDYEEAHPNTAVLVVEVADSSVNYDRTVKAALYAQAGVPEYWVLNLRERRLEVYRQPDAAADPARYTMTFRLAESETVVPLAALSAVISVSDLLPRRREQQEISAAP